MIVLMYHNIGYDEDIYTITPETFSAHIELFSRHRDSVIITFDDGYRSIKDSAIPVLLEAKLRVIVFPVVEMLGRQLEGRQLLDSEDLKDLLQKGVEIGSHGLNHKEITSQEVLEYEAARSKEILEDLLGCSVDYFSMPRGVMPKGGVDLLKDLGYKAVFVSEPDRWDGSGFLVPRFVVRKTDRLSSLSRLLKESPGEIFKRKVQRQLIWGIKGLLGVERYDSLKRGLFSKK